MENVRIGIIGIGNMGSVHSGNIMDGKVPSMTLTAVADINPARLDWARGKFPGLSTFASGEELMDSGLVDAVLIATPHYFHPPLAAAAFSRGLHVMCEKPAGVYTAQVKEMNAAAKASGKKFGMMFNNRTNPLFGKMRAIVQSGELGALRRSNWIITDWYRPQCYYNSGGWRATWAGEGGGVLLNQCPHNLDLWQWITGMPVRVRAFTHEGKWHDIEVEDDVTAYVEYEGGATGLFVTSTADAPGTNRFELQFDGGQLVNQGGRLTMTKLEMYESEFTKTTTGAFSSPARETFDVDCTGYGDNGHHNTVLEKFAQWIQGVGEPIAEGYEGIFGLTLSNAMHLSSWLDKTVELPLDDALFYAELQKKIAASTGKKAVADVVSNTAGSY